MWGSRTRFSKPPQPGQVIYAIGDLHGRLDLFDKMIATIHAREPAALIITLGDYIDRGPDSLGCIDRLMDLHATPGCHIRSLMGNHEDALIRFLNKPVAGARWLAFGGESLFAELGLHCPDPADGQDAFLHARDALIEKLGPDRIAFIEKRELSRQYGNVFFCHAGTIPNLPLEAQDRKTLLWNKDYGPARKDGNWTVHGHKVTSKPDITSGRINIDTGAVFTGNLTAARLDGGPVEFLTICM